jgi:hypothetical protein
MADKRGRAGNARFVPIADISQVSSFDVRLVCNRQISGRIEFDSSSDLTRQRPSLKLICIKATEKTARYWSGGMPIKKARKRWRAQNSLGC